MSHPDLSLDPAAARAVKSGHPVVYREHLSSRTRGLESGAVVDLLGGRSFLGRGIYDAEGPVAVRVLTRRKKEEIDGEFWRAGVARALELRRTLLNLTFTDAWRAVNAEGDFLPGLVVETYSSYGVIYLQSESLRPHLGRIVDAVRATLQPRGLYEKRSGPDGGRGHHLGGSNAPDSLPVREGNGRFLVRFAEGAKTGLFLDMRDSRRVLARYARGRHVVNCFSYTGALSVTAAMGGSPRVVSVDPSSRSIAWARENFSTNGLPPESHEFLSGDPLEVLGRLAKSTRRFDLAVIDTPFFHPPEPEEEKPKRKASRKAVRGKRGSKGKAAKKRRTAAKKKGKRRRMAPPRAALPPEERFRRGYADLLRSSIQVLNPHGLLACTLNERHVSFDEFLQMIKDAAIGSGVDLQILEAHGLPADFPSSASYPRGRYLKFLVCALRS